MTVAQKRSSRKWRVFKVRFGIDIVTIGIALVVALRGGPSALELLVAGFGDLSLNVATYFAANVAQTRAIGENYHKELEGD